MRNLIILVFVILISNIAYGQQFPLQSQYQFNYSMINPSVIVENDFTSLRTSFRQQWVGFSDNPIATQNLSLYRGFGKNGVGFNAFNDETGGAFNTSGLSLSYAHKVLFPEYEVYLGLSGGFSKVNISNVSDPSITNTEDILPDVTFGAFLKRDNLRVGISVPGLLNENMELTSSNDNTIKSNIYTMVAYSHKVNDLITLYPSILLKTTENKNQLDANLNMKIKNQIWVGASYRQDFGPSVFVGIDFGKFFSIYSHDISTNEAYSYSNGSHEFTLGYDFNYNLDSVVEQVAVKVDEFENDLDKDGVKDSVDLCPNQFGSIKAYGCIDVDDDGIPNEYDLCPNLYGKLELQGCPEITHFEKNIVYKALNDLKFDFDKADIKYSSYPTLTDMSLLLLKNPKMYIHISGYSSSEGSSDYNLGLSARRAKAVQNFFVERGIKKSRLILDYFGEENPLNNNENELEKAQNRRVEFSLEYHVYAIEESNNLRELYKQALINKNLDYSYLNSSATKLLFDNSDFEKVKIEELQNKFNTKIISESSIKNDTLEKNNQIEENKLLNHIDDSQDIDYEIEKNESLSEIDQTKYILVIAVLSNENNALSYIKSHPDVKFELIDGKYYLYEKSDVSKEKLVQIKLNYKKDSWIKQIR